MKILHTSDWHLGRAFHGRVLDEAHAAFADHLVELVTSEAVDAVVISGDVYDRAVPPTSAVALLDDTLSRLTERTRVVLTPGNHDSATRLGFGSHLLRPELAVRTQVAGVSTPVLLPGRDGTAGAYVYALPYLDPDAARCELPPLLADELGEQLSEEQEPPGAAAPGHGWPGTDEDPAPAPPPRLARSHEAVVCGALRLVGADLARRRTRTSTRVPAVVMAHAFVAGGLASAESERDLRVGGVDSVPAGVFATLGGSPHAAASGGVDYVALGHLHRPQEVTVASQQPGAPRLVYSGSPLAFSFSEAPWPKSTVLAEIGPEGVTRLERVPAPVPHPVVTVAGSLDELLSPATTVPAGSWVRAVVHGPLGPGDHARLREHLGEVLAVSVQLPQADGTATPQSRPSATSDPLDVAARFVQDVAGRSLTPAERQVLARAYEAVLASERSR